MQREISELQIVPYSQEFIALANTFNCGNIYLNRFLQSSDSLNPSIGKTYIALSPDGKSIIGFFNIGVGHINIVGATEEKQKIGGSAHINDFALDQQYHRLKIGMMEDQQAVYLSDVLLAQCMEIISKIRQDNIGFAFITLASTEQGRYLYERNGFELLEEDMRIGTSESEIECYPMYYAFPE